jgi:hypothetical protein
LVFVGGTHSWTAFGVEPTDDQFREAAGCSTCMVDSKTRLTLPETGVEAYTAKLSNSTEEWHRVTLLGNGSSADEDALFANERDTRVARYGKLTRELFERVQAALPTDRLYVTIVTTAAIPLAEKERLTTDEDLNPPYSPSRVQPQAEQADRWTS